MTVLLVLAAAIDRGPDRHMYGLAITAPVSVPLMAFDRHITFLGLLIVCGGYSIAFLAAWYLLARLRRPPARGFAVQIAPDEQKRA